MNVKIMKGGNLRRNKRWEQAFADGLDVHGQAYDWVPSTRQINNCDMFVVWSLRPVVSPNRKPTINRARLFGNRRASRITADVLVLEQSYFGGQRGRQSNMASIGFNGLNGRAEFHNSNSPCDRWIKHGLPFEPWVTEGDYILLVGQVPEDTSHRFININQWYTEAVAWIRKQQPDCKILFRPHPAEDRWKGQRRSDLSRATQIPNGVEVSSGNLQEDLKHASHVVTFNSNVGVDAVIAGRPVMAFDCGSMVYELASDLGCPNTCDETRQRWANNLAYCQWTIDEVRCGEAWSHLKKRYAAGRR